MGVVGAASARTWGRQWPERGLLLLLLLMTCWTVTTRAGKNISRRACIITQLGCPRTAIHAESRMGSPAETRLASLFQLMDFDEIRKALVFGLLSL